jgi:hypothetical protein
MKRARTSGASDDARAERREPGGVQGAPPLNKAAFSSHQTVAAVGSRSLGTRATLARETGVLTQSG